MNTFVEALEAALTNKEYSDEVKADIKKLGEDVDNAINTIVLQGYPAESITIRTINEDDGSMTLVFLSDGREIPTDLTYEQFMESKNED